MKITSGYSVELRKQNIPIRQILDIYRSAVSYLTEVYEQVWEELERKTNEKSNRICICTSWKYREISKSIAEECQVDLIDAVNQPDADLSSYDMIGFASGIYFSKFHQSILEFAEKNLPDDKKVFLICTYGGSANYKSIEQILDKKRSKVIGKFGCKGYDTFGPFKLVGGIAKGHPDEEDIKNAVEFVKVL